MGCDYSGAWAMSPQGPAVPWEQLLLGCFALAEAYPWVLPGPGASSATCFQLGWHLGNQWLFWVFLESPFLMSPVPSFVSLASQLWYMSL